MIQTMMILPVLLPLILGLISLLFHFQKASSRRMFYMVLICLNTVLAWIAIINCSDTTFTLLHFTENTTLSFHIDGAGRVFAALSATLWPFTALYACDYMKHEEHLSMFWAFFTASFGVTLGIAFAGNMLTMYLFYELLTLCTIPLVMHAMTKKAIRAGIKYAVYSMAGAALAFIGLVYLILNGKDYFQMGGTVADISSSPNLAIAVFVLSFIGFAVKAAMWPLHSWLPEAAVAPTPVTALLHAVAVVKAGAFACIRLVYYSFGTDLLRGTWGQDVVMALSIITIVYGSAMALKQVHFKRRLAYSTVSNLSYILFAITLMTAEGLLAGFLHLLFHSVIKIAAFFCAGAVLHYAKREYISELEGIGKYMPVTFAAFTVCACALTGVPLFNGFVSKWYIATAAVSDGRLLPVLGFAALLVSALLTAVYMFQVVIKAWFPRLESAPVDKNSVSEANVRMLLPIAILAVSCIILGLRCEWLIELLKKVVGI